MFLDLAGPLLLALFLAFLTESTVEYLFGVPMDKIPSITPYKWLLQYVAVVVGVGVCFHYQLDLVQLIRSGEVTPVGIVLTGISVSRGAVWLHDNVFKKYFVRG